MIEKKEMELEEETPEGDEKLTKAQKRELEKKRKLIEIQRGKLERIDKIKAEQEKK